MVLAVLLGEPMAAEAARVDRAAASDVRVASTGVGGCPRGEAVEARSRLERRVARRGGCRWTAEAEEATEAGPAAPGEESPRKQVPWGKRGRGTAPGLRGEQLLDRPE